MVEQVGISVILQAEIDEFERLMQRADSVFTATTTNLDKSAKRSVQSFERMEAALFPLVNAENRLAKSIALVNTNLEKGIISKDRAAKAVDALNVRYKEAVDRINRFGNESTRGQNSARQMGLAMQQAGFQVGDFAVQVASGQGVLRPLIQQGTQLVQAFGPLGAVAGAAGAIFGALITAFWDADEATDSLSGSYELATQRIDRYNSSVEKAIDLSEKQARAFRDAANEEVTRNKGELAELQLQLADKQSELASVNRQLEANFSGSLGALPGASETHFEYLRGLREQLVGTSEAVKEYQLLVSRGFVDEAGQPVLFEDIEDGIGTITVLEHKIADLAGALDVASGDAVSFGEAIADVTAKIEEDIAGEVAANEQLAAALRVSEREYDIVLRTMKILATEGYNGTAEAARELAIDLVDSETAIDRVKEATKAAAKAQSDLDKEVERANQAYDKYIISLEDTNEELLADVQGRDRLIPLLKAESELRARMGRELLPEEKDRLKELVDERERLSRILAEQEEAEKQLQQAAEKAARETQRVWDQAGEGIQDALADAIFEGKDLFGSLKDVARRTASEIAAAMIFRPLISPIIQGGGLSVPGFGGGMIGGGGGFNLGSLQSIGSGLFDAGNLLFNSGGAGAFREFATGSIGQALGLSQALPRGGSIGLTGFGGQASQAFGRLSSLGGIAGGFAGNFLADSLLGDRGVGASIGGSIGAIAGSFIPVPILGTAIGAFAGNAIGGLFGNNRPSEGQTIAANLDGFGNIVEVGTDNGGSQSSAQQLGDAFSTAIKSLLDLTGGSSVNGLVRISQSARSGLRLGEGDSWRHFGSEADLLNYLVDNRLTGGDASLVRAARLSNATSVDGLIGDVATAKQIQSIILAANENLSPLEQAVKAINEQFKELIDISNRLGQDTASLIRIRDQEIQKTREASALQDRLQAQNRVATELGFERDILTAFGGAAAQIQSFSTAYNLSAGSSLSPIDRIALAQSEFDKLAESVGAGNIGAVGAFTQSAQTLLSLGRDAYASTGAFGSIERDVFSKLSSAQASLVSPENISRNLTDALAALDLSDEARNDKLIQALRDEIRSLKTEVVQLRVMYEAS